MMQLKIIEGENIGTLFELLEGENLAGRSRSAGIRLEAPDVSGKHLMIVVKDGKAIARNLGRSGASINEQPLTEPVVLQSGEILRLGASTALQFEDDASAPVNHESESAGDLSATGVGGALGTQPEATGVMPKASADVPEEPPLSEKTGVQQRTVALQEDEKARHGDVPRTVAAARSGDSPEGGTRIMQTRIASQEEIEFLREAERRRAKRKLTLATVVGALVILSVFLLWPRRPPPETTISWPRDESGRFVDAFLPSPSNGGFKDGGFDLAFPGNPGWTSNTLEDGKVVIVTMLGQARDIPLRLILEERIDRHEADISRFESFKAWMAETKETGGRWSFNPPSNVFFLGRGNGIPYISASYHREDDSSWYGVATIFRHGTSRVVLRAEVPAAERVRAEAIVSTRFFYASEDFIKRHWEGGGENVSGNAANLIRQARRELNAISPAAWAQVENVIITALRKAVLAGDKEKEAEALQLLVRLRDNQALWFNAQRIAYFNAWAVGDEKQAARVTEICKAIFSSANDQRYYAIRQNRW